jgi:hypothetical protein
VDDEDYLPQSMGEGNSGLDQPNEEPDALKTDKITMFESTTDSHQPQSLTEKQNNPFKDHPIETL